MIVPVIGIVERHTDQPDAVFFGTGHQTPARALGIARLAADTRFIEFEELVVILIGHALIIGTDKPTRAARSGLLLNVDFSRL